MSHWDTIQTYLRTGSRCIGSVASITEYGCFIEVLPGIEGLLRTGPDGNSHRRFDVGQEVEVVVIELSPTDQRMALALVEHGRPVDA